MRRIGRIVCGIVHQYGLARIAAQNEGENPRRRQAELALRYLNDNRERLLRAGVDENGLSIRDFLPGEVETGRSAEPRRAPEWCAVSTPETVFAEIAAEGRGNR